MLRSSRVSSPSRSLMIMLRVAEMSGCLDQISCNCNVDWDGKRNGIASVVSATLFFSAWWLMLDTAAVYDKKDWTNVSAFSAER